MATSSFQQRTENDVFGLRTIARFGWIRSAELSLFMFEGKWRRTQTDRVVRSWVKRNLVIERILPEGAGRAIVLATAGVRLLAGHGYSAKSGKNEGDMVDGVWHPPFAWKHHLMAHGVLGHLHARGGEVTTEHEIKPIAGIGKRPDGLMYSESIDRYFWLEVEQAKKDGRDMEELAKALYQVSTVGLVVADKNCTGAIIAFNPSATDKRGYGLNHQDRVRSAISKIAQKPIIVTWCQCQMKGLGVEAIALSTEEIFPDYAAHIRRELERWGWRPGENRSLLCEYKRHRIKLSEGDGLWYCVLDQEDMACVCSESLEDAKKKTVLAILERGW